MLVVIIETRTKKKIMLFDSNVVVAIKERESASIEDYTCMGFEDFVGGGCQMSCL